MGLIKEIYALEFSSREAFSDKRCTKKSYGELVMALLLRSLDCSVVIEKKSSLMRLKNKHYVSTRSRSQLLIALGIFNYPGIHGCLLRFMTS